MEHKHNLRCRHCRKPLPDGASAIWCDECSSRVSPYFTRLNDERRIEVVCPGCDAFVLIGQGDVEHKEDCRVALEDKMGAIFNRVSVRVGDGPPVVKVDVIRYEWQVEKPLEVIADEHETTAAIPR